MREFRDPSSGLANIVKFVAFKKAPADASLFFDGDKRVAVRQALDRQERGEPAALPKDVASGSPLGIIASGLAFGEKNGAVDATAKKATKPRGTSTQRSTLLTAGSSAGASTQRRTLLGST